MSAAARNQPLRHETHASERDRLHWDRQRTLLSRERTFSAWIRTGLSAEVAGLAIARWLGTETAPWIATTLGALLALIGGLIFVYGFTSYMHALQTSGAAAVNRMPGWISAVLTFALTGTVLLALFLIYR